MSERTSTRRRRNSPRKKQDDNVFVTKTVIQSVTALIIFLVVWGMSLFQHPVISDVCNKIRHYLTYTYDVQSVFNNLYNVPEVNDDTH